MKWPWKKKTSQFRLLRELVSLQRRQTEALEALAVSVRALSLGPGVGNTLVTGFPDGMQESAVSYTSNTELAELLEVEQELHRTWGRAPTEEEVVAVWQNRS